MRVQILQPNPVPVRRRHERPGPLPQAAPAHVDAVAGVCRIGHVVGREGVAAPAAGHGPHAFYGNAPDDDAAVGAHGVDDDRAPPPVARAAGEAEAAQVYGSVQQRHVEGYVAI